MSNARIMIVEDEAIVALDLQHKLKTLGYAVSGVASSGEEAVRKVPQTRPDLVLMDIKLKGDMDGIEAAQRIRDEFNIPVVYLTAYSDENTLQRAKVTEPAGYLLKPFKDRELHATIEMALYKHKIEMELKKSAQKFATIILSIGDAVIATDLQGRVTFMNPVAETLTGWNLQDAIGRDMSDVFNIVNEDTREAIGSGIAGRPYGLTPGRRQTNHLIIQSAQRLLQVQRGHRIVFNHQNPVTHWRIVARI